jgi:hypothetical protein
MMIIAALGSFAVLLTAMALAPTSGRSASSASRMEPTSRESVNAISPERLSAPLSNA